MLYRASSILLLLAAWLASAPSLAAQLIHALEGESAGEYFGRTLADLGDLDGDGYGDFLVGSWDGFDPAAPGKVEVFSGRNAELLFSAYGLDSDDFFGSSVACAGDVNGDGHVDYVVGAPEEDGGGTRRGAVWVFSGADGTVLHHLVAPTDNHRFGTSVAGLGDLNGDGMADFAATWRGALQQFPWSQGLALAFSGATGEVLFTYRDDPVTDDDHGWCLAGAGDVNGDGKPDLLIGRPGFDDSAGKYQILSGADGSLLHEGLPHGGEAPLGRAVAAAGDVDSDGFDDYLVSASYGGAGFSASESVRLYSGADHSVALELSEFEDGENFGGSVAGGRDLNGDGVPDVLVGASYAGSQSREWGNGSDAGMAHAFSGADGRLLFQAMGYSVTDYFGTSVALVEDLDADGRADVVVGAPSTESAGEATGSVYVFAGGDLLDLGGLVPGRTGEVNSVTISGAASGATLVLLGNRRWGRTDVACAGGMASVYIENAKFAGSVVADGTGAATIQRFLPARFQGFTLRMQAVEVESCRFSNLSARRIHL